MSVSVLIRSTRPSANCRGSALLVAVRSYQPRFHGVLQLPSGLITPPRFPWEMPLLSALKTDGPPGDQVTEASCALCTETRGKSVAPIGNTCRVAYLGLMRFSM